MKTNMFHHIFHVSLGAALALSLATMSSIAAAAGPQSGKVKNVVLVHGAFADGTSWSKLIPILEARGYHVTAVQNPLTSLADDVAATKRILALQSGKVILVGHSWGGAVITQAGDDPHVAGLVYVAAYTPEAGSSANETSAPFGVTSGQKSIAVDAQHFASLTPAGIVESFAQGLPMPERRLVLAVQGQSYGPMFDEKITVASWKNKPSWHVVSSQDRMLSPEMEKEGARRANGKVAVLPTCHVAMLQAPDQVADVIDEAATHALAQ